MLASCIHEREETGMQFDLESSRDLGLQHVIENGLVILDGEDLEPERRHRVIHRLLVIVSKADQGAVALVGARLNFAAAERAAIESFTFFHRHLGRAAQDLPGQLAAAKEALEGLDENRDVGDQRRRALRDLLSSLLAAIELERALQPLVAPRQLHY